MSIKIKYTISIIYLILFVSRVNSQHRDTIKIKNPSFEDIPQCCQSPWAWTDCGFRGETPPDIQPAIDKDGQPFFHVTQEPMDGATYLGMVVRENGTYERVSQSLNSTLHKGSCYKFNIMLCRSESYLSPSNKSEPSHLFEFITPVILRIWGGQSFCNQKQQLANSSVIENTDWQKYEFQFKAEYDMSYIQLEAYYNTNVEFPYNGNLLLDNASDIIEIDCDSLKTK